jgi:hypothetical protein
MMVKCQLCGKELINFGNIILHPPKEGEIICQEKDAVSIVIEDQTLFDIFQAKYKEKQVMKPFWKKIAFWKP